MKWFLFKLIMFGSAFTFMQAIVLPWFIENEFIPMWGSVLLISFVLVVWLAAIDRLTAHFIRLDGGTNDYSDRY